MPSLVGNGDYAAELARHMKLLHLDTTRSSSEIHNAPIFSASVKLQARELSGPASGRPFAQYGLLAGISRSSHAGDNTDDQQQHSSDPRLFYNVSTPSSVFICGSQGSGKSHTLSCLLENCLLPSAANVLPRPLTGVVFHYDTFNSDTGGTPSEVAFLSSNPEVKVRVLCAPTNRNKIEEIYSCLPNVEVAVFRIHESQLNTKRMLDLMAMGSVAGDSWPLYMHTVTRILRDMRLAQQALGEDGFNYGDFKRRLTDEGLVGSQLGPLQQRLDALESFMVPGQATQTRLRSGEGKHAKNGKFVKGARTIDNTWTPKAGRLTIVDLSCPCITDVTACSLFTICLSLFLEQESDVGRVVALDEAHKYMTGSLECETLTERLLSAIRLQRHLAARVFISTQEPTISPKLLDLCSATIVHRFTSPEWLQTLKSHLAGASSLAGAMTAVDSEHGEDDVMAGIMLRSGNSEHRLADIFQQLVSLRTGEALLFAPNAAVGVRMRSVEEEGEEEGETESESAQSPSAIEDAEDSEQSGNSSEDLRSMDALRLGSGALKIYIRHRVTQDGGKSIMAE